MRMLYFAGIAIFIFLAATALAQEKSIAISAEYAGNSEFDSDNDGIAPIHSAIDFTVENSVFSWPANDSNLCTRWHVIPEGSDFSTMVCNGAAHCCSIVELLPSSDKWDDPFYLSSQLYETSSRNDVGAQVIHADYSLDSSSDVDIAYSEMSYLQAAFEEQLSSQGSASVTVVSPQNSSAISSGESVKLIITVDATATAAYSLNGAPNKTMSTAAISGGTNLSATLTGSLPAGVLNNSNHLANVFISTSSENITIEHAFEVSDTTAPVMALINLSNTTSVIRTDEVANISYLLNGIAYNKTLNSSNDALLILNVSNGINNLSITATDMHGNGNTVSHALNATIESCTDAVQNYHGGQMESGVDCGGSCNACVNLSVSTDKSSYAVNELVYIQVAARSDAAHNITVTGPSYFTSLSYNGSTYYIITPTNPGTYTANVSLKYRELTAESVATTFAVNATASSNPLSVSISRNSSTVSVGDVVEHVASVSGNTSTLSYKWDVNGDNATDFTTGRFNYSYASPGSYFVNLTVTDGKWNRSATETLEVKPLYNVTVDIKDRTTDLGIPAVVILHGHETTSPYSTQLKKGSYRLTANYSGYTNYSSSIDVDGNETITIYLTTNIAPVVTLLSPSNGSVLTSNESGLQFEVSRYPLTCTLYMGSGSNLAASATRNVNATQYTFPITVDNSTFSWKVSCIDGAGNIGESSTNEFTITHLSKRDEAIRKDIQAVLGVVDSVISNLDSMPGEEKEAASIMNYRKLLDDAKFELQRANRDIFNIEWRRFNSTEEGKFRDETVNRVEIVKGNFTTNISVLRSSEFVSYPEDETVEDVAREYAGSGLYTEAEVSNYVSRNMELQKEVSVTTRYINLELTRYNGLIDRTTLVERRLSYDNVTDAAVVEVIPKSIANSAADVDVFAVHKVIKDDPVIEITPVDKKYAFLLEGTLTPIEMQSVETLLIKKKVDALPRKGSGITGLAVLDLDTLSSTRAIIIEVIVLALIGGLYFAYGRNAESSNLKEIRSLVKDAYGFAGHEFGRSEELYGKISGKFRELGKEERSIIYHPLIELGHKIRKDHVRNSLGEIHVLLSYNQHDAARKVYRKISALYKSLPPHHRKELYSDCNEVHRRLSQGK